MTSRTMSISIKRNPKSVYEFVFNLENLPKWANTAFQSIREQDGEWIVRYATRISESSYYTKK